MPAPVPHHAVRLSPTLGRNIISPLPLLQLYTIATPEGSRTGNVEGSTEQCCWFDTNRSTPEKILDEPDGLAEEGARGVEGGVAVVAAAAAHRPQERSGNLPLHLARLNYQNLQVLLVVGRVDTNQPTIQTNKQTTETVETEYIAI